jgi:hypothetical protein
VNGAGYYWSEQATMRYGVVSAPSSQKHTDPVYNRHIDDNAITANGCL